MRSTWGSSETDKTRERERERERESGEGRETHLGLQGAEHDCGVLQLVAEHAAGRAGGGEALDDVAGDEGVEQVAALLRREPHALVHGELPARGGGAAAAQVRGEAAGGEEAGEGGGEGPGRRADGGDGGGEDGAVGGGDAGGGAGAEAVDEREEVEVDVEGEGAAREDQVVAAVAVDGVARGVRPGVGRVGVGARAARPHCRVVDAPPYVGVVRALEAGAAGLDQDVGRDAGGAAEDDGGGAEGVVVPHAEEAAGREAEEDGGGDVHEAAEQLRRPCEEDPRVAPRLAIVARKQLEDGLEHEKDCSDATCRTNSFCLELRPLKFVLPFVTENRDRIDTYRVESPSLPELSLDFFKRYHILPLLPRFPSAESFLS